MLSSASYAFVECELTSQYRCGIFRFSFFFSQVVYRVCLARCDKMRENMHACEPGLEDTLIAVERRTVGFYLQFKEGALSGGVMSNSAHLQMKSGNRMVWM